MSDTTIVLPITLTEIAAAHIRQLIAERGAAGQALRVFVAGSGCSGLRYGMALEATPRPDDVRGQSSGVDVLIDPVSMSYMGGSVIDYVEQEGAAGFRIDNPNAAAGCSCGQAGASEDSADRECATSGCGGCA
jgi:iron-sulfur cluster assembly protein